MASTPPLSPRLRSPRLLLCALALVACGGADAAQEAVPSFDAARAWGHLEAMVAIGPRTAGSPGAEETRQYIEAQLRSMGLKPVRESFTAQTPVGPIEMANVYVDLPAAGPQNADGTEAPIVILCGHYETKRFKFEFVGANDSASGTGTLIELSRSLSQRESPVTYRILFLDGEESINEVWKDPDNRYGSKYHAAGLKQRGQVSQVAACVLLDLIGDRNLNVMREQYSDQKLLGAFQSAAKDLGLEAHMRGRREPVKDDHLSFMEVGIRSVDLIDLDYGPGNSYWHSPEDTLDKVSQESLDKIGRIVLHGLPKLEALVIR